MEHFRKQDKDAAAVIMLPIIANPKVVADVIKHVQSKMKEKSVYVIAADNKDAGADGRVVHGCYVSSVNAQTFSCHGSH
jgi:alanyl-tRNA synthetase